MASVPDDLRFAATIFLQGSESPVGKRRVQVGISREAVARVEGALRDCDPDAISAIIAAVTHYRREGSWRSREAVIEAVTLAVLS